MEFPGISRYFTEINNNSINRNMSFLSHIRSTRALKFENATPSNDIRTVKVVLATFLLWALQQQQQY